MEYRHPPMVIFLPIITFGIYPLVWIVKTKNEMNKHYGIFIQPAWYLLIPFVNLYWLWCYAKGIETVTEGKRIAVEVLLLIIFLYFFGMAIIQADFNKVYIPQRQVESEQLAEYERGKATEKSDANDTLRVTAASNFCSQCFTENNLDSVFCEKCGTRLDS